jgi:hypothetical protein
VGAAPASAAASPERFVGSAAGRALDISLLRTNATFGDSTASVTSALDPVAKAAGQLLPTLVGATSANVASPNSGRVCALPSLPAPVGDIIDLGLACSASNVSVLNGLASADSVGSVASLGIDASSLIAALGLPDLQETLDQVTAPVLGALEPVITAVEEATGVDVDKAVTTVEELLDQLLTTKALDVTVGQGTSNVLTEAGKLTSIGHAEGATITVLPTSTLLGNVALAKITIGESTAQAVYDRGTGKAVPSFSAALVHVQVAALPGLTPAIDQAVAPGQTITLFPGTLLQSTITVADGRTESLADGGVKAIADGVSLELLQGLNASSPTAFDGGLAVRLAHSEAQVAGAPATTEAPVVAGVTALPRTGGTPWIPMAGIGVLALALVGRRVSTRSARS